jgi:hypothetical protein
MVLGVAALATSIAVATVVFERSSHQRVQARVNAPSLPTGLAGAMRGRSVSVPAGVELPPVIVPSSVTPHGSFASLRGERYYIFEGSPRSGALGAAFTRGSVPSRCVTAIGPRFSAVACGHPLVNSDLFFFEGSEGGSAAGPQSEHYISGLRSPRVARIEMLDSSGAIEQAQINSSGAFFVELPAAALAKGIRFETLRAYDRNGVLIEQAGV